MAEADPNHSPNPEPYLKGSFKISKVLYEVILSETALSWYKNGDGGKNAVNVPVEEILCAEKLVGADEAVCGFYIAYIKQKKKNVRRHKVVNFYGSAEEGESWSRKIQESIDKVPGRPRKVLVLVNPVSGNSNGRQIYQKKAAKIFQMAHIETDVIVTEKAHHTEEILSTYDLSSIDGIVLVGGDGIYHEAVNGLQLRMLKESGLDKNDLSINLQPISMPIGIIPAGTGNGVASNCNGCYDVESAVLTIVMGKRRYYNIVAVHCCGELVSYSSLLVGYGLWGDMIYTAETKRHLGKLRYAVCMMDMIFKSMRHTELVVEYLPPGQRLTDKCDAIQNTDKGTTTGSTETAASETGWQRFDGDFAGAVVFLEDLFPVPEKSTALEDSLTLLMNKPCGAFNKLGFLKKFITYDASFLDGDIVSYKLVKEYKVKVVNPSDPQSDTGRKEHILNIDGEIFHLKKPDFLVRLHPKTVPMFSRGLNLLYSGFSRAEQTTPTDR